MAEKKYLIGYLWGKEHVMFDDVHDVEETFDEESGTLTIKFKDIDGEYEYKGNNARGYRETHNKAPFMSNYKIVGRRTVKKHNLLDPEARTEIKPKAEIERPEEREPEKDWVETHGRRVTVSGISDVGCGSSGEYREVSGCGGSTVYRRDACGGWTPVYGNGPCGAVYTRPYYGGCGGSYGCGGGGC